MRPLLVDLEMQWRGGQNQVLLLLKGLRARGHQPELVAAKGSALEERARVCGVPVYSASRGLLRLPAARRIHTLVRSGRFDLIHVNESQALTAAWLARTHRALPLIISRRVGYPLGKSVVSRMRFQAARWIIANSQWVADQVAGSGVSREKIKVVFEGVEIPQTPSAELRMQARARWGVMDNAPLLGCVAVLSPDKGQEMLIRALPPLRKQFPACRLLLAGDGPCRRDLHRLAEELGVEDAVIFAGFVKEIEMVYAALDIFLFPALFEGLGTSLLAAMSHGVPSIAFERCAFGEIIQHEKNGLLMKTAGHEGMQNAAARLLLEAEFAQKLGAAGRQRIEETFSTENMVRETIRVYSEAAPDRAQER